MNTNTRNPWDRLDFEIRPPAAWISNKRKKSKRFCRKLNISGLSGCDVDPVDPKCQMDSKRRVLTDRRYVLLPSCTPSLLLTFLFSFNNYISYLNNRFLSRKKKKYFFFLFKLLWEKSMYLSICIDLSFRIHLNNGIISENWHTLLLLKWNINNNNFIQSPSEVIWIIDFFFFLSYYYYYLNYWNYFVRNELSFFFFLWYWWEKEIHQKGASPKGLGWPHHREKKNKRGFMGWVGVQSLEIIGIKELA